MSQFFPGLNQLIHTSLDSTKLYTDASGLDPILIEWENKGCSEQLAETVYDCLTRIRSRLFWSGFHNYNQGIVASPEILKQLSIYLYPKSLKVRLIRSRRIGNNLFILTKSADGRLFIHPPYDNQKPISWDDYFLRIAGGENLSLMIDVPWAQAKIVNII